MSYYDAFMDEILSKGHIVRIPRGTTIKKGKVVTTTGKSYVVHLHHSYGPTPYEGWEGAPVNHDWDAEYVVVWIGSGNLWMQARMQDVEPKWTQQEVDENNGEADELDYALGINDDTL